MDILTIWVLAWLIINNCIISRNCVFLVCCGIKALMKIHI